MRIGIDARFYGSVGKGLGRYTEKLIEHLEVLDTDNDYVVFLRRENFDEYVPKNACFKKALAQHAWYGFSEQLLFPFCLLLFRLDLVHFPHFNVPVLYPKKFIVTIHDLILLHYPTRKCSTRTAFFYRMKFAAYRFVIARAIRRAEHIIAVSHFTKRDILDRYPAARGKVSVTYEAADSAYQFVLVGKEDYFYRRLKKRVEEQDIRNVVFAGFVDDRELSALYRFALCYIFPSLYEGFGLPPLEAMAHGLPVLSSRSGSLQEILGGAARYFDSQAPGSFEGELRAMMHSETARQELILRGYRQAARFSWERMALETQKLYTSSIKNKD